MADAGRTRDIVAIVDDDPFIRAALRRLVLSIGYEVLLFDSAESMLSYDAAAELFCVLADLQMPGVTGIDLIKALSERHPSLPLIAMTAYPNEAIRQRALDSGASTYLTKPFDAAILEMCLSRFRSRHGS
jgi:FixJ family two-component response regulator